MLGILSQAIDRIYKKKEYDFFRDACSKPLELCKELKDYIDSKAFRLEENSNLNSPVAKWTIYLNGCDEQNFNASFKTTLQISKIIPLFHVWYHFSVENRDPNGIGSYLAGSTGSGLEYSMEQYFLQEAITSILTRNGFQEVYYIDMQEVVLDLKMPHGITNLGPQIKVEHLLFNDIFGLLDANSTLKSNV